MKGHRFEALDALRGLVALAVVLFHAGFNFQIPHFFTHGFLGVDFFFVLSGFVIGQAYEARLISGSLRFADFVRMRIIRLYPMAVIGTLLGFVVHRPGSPVELLSGLVLAPMTKAPGNVIFPLDSVLWSLFFELIVNFAYALLAPRLRTGWLYAVAAVSFAVFAVHGKVHSGFWCDDFWWGAPRTLFSFSVGLIIHRRYQAGTLPVVRAPAWLVLGLFGLFLALPFPPTGHDVYDLVLLAVLPPLVVVAGVNWRPQGALLWLSKLSGELSYPVYALHLPLIFAVLKLHLVLGLPLAGRLAVTAGLCVATCGLAWAALRGLDAPARQMLTAIAAPKRRVAAASAAE